MPAMSFNKWTHVKECNLWGSPSVTLCDKERKHLASSYTESCNNIQTNHALYKVLHKLVRSKMDWKFQIQDTIFAHNGGEATGHVATEFLILAGKVPLGSVSIVTRGEREYIRVYNDKIQATVSRGKGYNTTDPEKAEKEIRRMFLTPSLDQKLAKEAEAAGEMLDGIRIDVNAKASMFWRNLDTARNVFVKQRFDEFVAMLTTTSDRESAANYKATKEEQASINRMRDAWTQRDKGTSLLVVLDGSQYIVRYASEVKLFNADTVPDDVRVKVGMLKLTEPKQVVDGLGVKVSNEVFIVVSTDVVTE